MESYLKRIILDIKDLTKSPIENIHYFPDEDDITNGTALIVGPENTPYAHGFYIFDFKFPSNYPYSPPKVVYKSNDGITRFNPNFYRSGKVCLSILNTWKGDQWSACQSIRSVLITLQMTLNDTPLLNEPGMEPEKNKSDILAYNSIITYKNIEYSIVRQYNDIKSRMLVLKETGQNYPYYYQEILEIMRTYVNSAKSKIIETCKYQQTTYECKERLYSFNFYNMYAKCNYSLLLQAFNNFLNDINDN